MTYSFTTHKPGLKQPSGVEPLRLITYEVNSTFPSPQASHLDLTTDNDLQLFSIQAKTALSWSTYGTITLNMLNSHAVVTKSHEPPSKVDMCRTCLECDRAGIDRPCQETQQYGYQWDLDHLCAPVNGALLGGPWDLVTTYNWPHKPTYNWGKLNETT